MFIKKIDHSFAVVIVMFPIGQSVFSTLSNVFMCFLSLIMRAKLSPSPPADPTTAMKGVADSGV